MSNALDVIDFNSRIRTKREDKLDAIQSDVNILKSDVKYIDMKIDVKVEQLNNKIDNNFELLNNKVDGLTMVVQSEIKRLDDKIDKNHEVLNTKIDNVVSMKKWVVLMFITILLALATLIGPNIVALFS